MHFGSCCVPPSGGDYRDWKVPSKSSKESSDALGQVEGAGGRQSLSEGRSAGEGRAVEIQGTRTLTNVKTFLFMTCSIKLANSVSPEKFKKQQLNPLPSERSAKAECMCVQWRLAERAYGEAIFMKPCVCCLHFIVISKIAHTER